MSSSIVAPFVTHAATMPCYLSNDVTFITKRSEAESLEGQLM